jgi:4-alpha-glucanotransferase
MERLSGILMPVFSLPSKYGAGSFGKESFAFVDFLVKSGQKLWQILPLVQTGYGNSPYSSVSAESINPYFISLETLKEEGLLTSTELKFALLDGNYIDYGDLYSVRYPLLKKAFSRFDKENKKFKSFVRNKSAYDYALFMALKTKFGFAPWMEWDKLYAEADEKTLNAFIAENQEEIAFHPMGEIPDKGQRRV